MSTLVDFRIEGLILGGFDREEPCGEVRVDMAGAVRELETSGGGSFRWGFWRRVRAELGRAFSLEAPGGPLDDEDRALLDGFAEAIARRRMQAPAVLWLEAMKPLHFIGAQALTAFRPLAHAVISAKRFDRITKILERRDGIEELLQRIEATQ